MAGTRVRKGIELIEVGEEWNASTGKVTFTREHLAAAIAAFDDEAVREPIIKLGHDSTLNDGEPALGRLLRPYLSADGMTLLGDYAGLPEWLDDGMPTLYPRRSVEGRFNYTTATGKTHAFMLTAVALLGAAYPAVTTLKDIELLMDADSIDDFDLVAASELQDNLVQGTEKGPDRLMAKKKTTEVAAAVAVDDVRREFYDSLDSEDYWSQWIRQIHVDPAELIVSDSRIEPFYLRIPYSIADESVTFGDAVRVREVFEDVPEDTVAASEAVGVVVYATADESRPAKDGSNDLLPNEVEPMSPEQLKAVGLAEDATQEQYDAKIAELVAAAGAASASNTETEGEGDETPPAPGSPPVVIPQQKEGEITVPEGTVLVNAAQREVEAAEFKRMQDFMEKQRVIERDQFIAAAQLEGKFPPSEVASLRAAYDEDETRVRRLIDTLPKGLVALSEIGHGEGGDEQPVEMSYSTVGLTPAEVARINSFKTQEA